MNLLTCGVLAQVAPELTNSQVFHVDVDLRPKLVCLWGEIEIRNLLLFIIIGTDVGVEIKVSRAGFDYSPACCCSWGTRGRSEGTTSPRLPAAAQSWRRGSSGRRRRVSGTGSNSSSLLSASPSWTL